MPTKRKAQQNEQSRLLRMETYQLPVSSPQLASSYKRKLKPEADPQCDVAVPDDPDAQYSTPVASNQLDGRHGGS